MKKLKSILQLFFTMFKIGLFTFGGGYAMVAVLESEIIEKKKWISDDEFKDLLIIAESTPGPIAVNSSTYIGYKLAGVLGAFFSTLAICLPSFIIIFIISLFFDKFLSLTLVAYAFKGIQVAVCYLILSAGIKMFKKSKKTAFSITLYILTIALFVTLTLLGKNFSTIFYILAGAVIGIVIYVISLIQKKKKGDGDSA